MQAALHGLHGGDAFVELVDVCLGNVLDLGAGPQFVAPQGQELADFFYRKAQIAAAADKAQGVHIVGGVLAVAAVGAGHFGEQPPRLVMAHHPC